MDDDQILLGVMAPASDPTGFDALYRSTAELDAAVAELEETMETMADSVGDLTDSLHQLGRAGR